MAHVSKVDKDTGVVTISDGDGDGVVRDIVHDDPYLYPAGAVIHGEPAADGSIDWRALWGCKPRP